MANEPYLHYFPHSSEWSIRCPKRVRTYCSTFPGLYSEEKDESKLCSTVPQDKHLFDLCDELYKHVTNAAIALCSSKSRSDEVAGMREMEDNRQLIWNHGIKMGCTGINKEKTVKALMFSNLVSFDFNEFGAEIDFQAAKSVSGKRFSFYVIFAVKSISRSRRKRTLSGTDIISGQGPPNKVVLREGSSLPPERSQVGVSSSSQT